MRLELSIVPFPGLWWYSKIAELLIRTPCLSSFNILWAIHVCFCTNEYEVANHFYTVSSVVRSDWSNISAQRMKPIFVDAPLRIYFSLTRICTLDRTVNVHNFKWPCDMGLEISKRICWSNLHNVSGPGLRHCAVRWCPKCRRGSHLQTYVYKKGRSFDRKDVFVCLMITSYNITTDIVELDINPCPNRW